MSFLSSFFATSCDANCWQPKYWCKHCQTFVKDTKLEKSNHEATGRHQGNLQRFLRGLHKDNEKAEREKQRAKDELDRLNGVAKKPNHASSTQSPAAPSSASMRQATPAERKRQLQQLADLGIAVPEDYRREAAMAGEWQTTSGTLVHHNETESAEVKREETKDEAKAPLNIGVRKRKFEGEEEEKEAGETVRRKGWGSTTRSYPGGSEDLDLDTLLNTKQENTARSALETTSGIKEEQATMDSNERGKPESTDNSNVGSRSTVLGIKEEEADQENIHQTEAVAHVGVQSEEQIKQENDGQEPEIVFKKRKAKSSRSKV